jgi:hypothetical protein
VRRALKLAGSLAVSIATCYLSFLLIFFVLFEFPRLFLVAFTGVELEGWEAQRTFGLFPRGVLPHAVTRFPENGSAALYAFYQSGFILCGIVLLLLGLGAARRTRNLLQLFSAYSVLWLAEGVALYSGLYVRASRSPLLSTLRALGGSNSEHALRVALGLILATVVVTALYLALRGVLDTAGEGRGGRLRGLARWLLAPLAGTTLLIHIGLPPYRSFFVAALVFSPVALALVAGLPAAWARGRAAAPLQTSVAGGLALLAVFSLTYGASLFQADLARLRRRTEMTEHESRHWRLYLDPGAQAESNIAELAASADERLERMAQRLGVELPNPRPRAFLYASPHAKRMMTGDDAPFTVEAGRHTVHHLLAPGSGITDARGDALLLLRSAWGTAGSEALERAIARYAVGDFYGYRLNDYAGRIANEETPYPLREVLALDGDYLSPLVRDALGGAWVASLVQRHGPTVLFSLYHARLEPGREETFAQALGPSWVELEADWRRTLSEAVAHTTSGPRTTPPDFYQRGISFSHEVGGDWGYGSDRAREELKKIHDLGANAIAVVPYAFTRAPREIRLRTHTDESDDRVVRTVEAAQQLGLHILLKPQLWGPGFTGDITFSDEADFARWFEQYRRWLLHYARLAELHQIDVLVIGTELGGLTRREAAWRRLIADIRRVYSGRLTYAANWGGEFETLPFWGALDYLGLNMYYPLAGPGETPRADSMRVRRLVEKFAALAHKYNKKILFTEVGYHSTANAAAEPWAEDRERLDLPLQAQCYRVIFEAFADQPWLAGLYWWKWPSDGRGSPYDPSYSPLGKPALAVLAQGYAQAGKP